MKKESREGTTGSPVPFATVVTMYTGASSLNKCSCPYLQYAYHFFFLLITFISLYSKSFIHTIISLSL